MSAASSDPRKRSKKRYAAGSRHSGKRWRGCRELEVGMQGILITCNMNERKCTAEAFNLLNEYADELLGPEKLQDNNASGSEEEEEDVDVALKKEVAQLKTSGAKQERRFQSLDSGANNVIFIKTQNLESDKLVHHILSDLQSTKKKKSRVILRMLPVTGTCKAFEEDILKYLTTFLEPWFKTPNCATYQIAFKARNSSHNKREEIIKSVAALVGKLNPKNKVDLTNPELTIIVEVIKAVCCVSVVKDYALFRKYNVQEVVKEDTAKPDGAAAPTDTITAEQEEEDALGADGTTREETKGGEGDGDGNVPEDKKEATEDKGDGDGE
uniref:THUMP domain-containing protein 1 n=2 Tax=Gasterosteus aculeatus TaxID=69293 RepID=G3Q7C9_GASAC|nr:THUMP domain-containing protein 1 [Gasterosteus aculeatus aculeatus]